MLCNYFRVFFILALISIAWNEVAAQINMHGVKGNNVVRNRRVAPYDSKLFLDNFFRTSCTTNEEYTDCQRMEGYTCWEPEPSDRVYPCRDGCDCIEGYLRDTSGLCVLRNQCSTKRIPLNYVQPLTIHLNKFTRSRNTVPGVQP